MKLFKSEKDKAFYGRIFALVAPIVVQNLLSAAVGSADVVMLNYVGQSAISAVSLATNYTSILFMVFYGLGTGATMLCAQYYGKYEYEPIRVVQGLAMRISLLVSAVFALAAILAFVVMYDAANVRHAAGEQAKVLNYMMDHWTQFRPEFFANDLKELLGHTPLQVFFGALIGLAIGIGGCWFFG